VIPEDVQAVFPSVAGHRLNAVDTDGDKAVEALLKSVRVP
jgi:hypothetical protein